MTIVWLLLDISRGLLRRTGESEKIQTQKKELKSSPFDNQVLSDVGQAL